MFRAGDGWEAGMTTCCDEIQESKCCEKCWDIRNEVKLRIGGTAGGSSVIGCDKNADKDPCLGAISRFILELKLQKQMKLLCRLNYSSLSSLIILTMCRR